MARTTIRSEDITASEVTTAKMAVDPTNASNLSSGSVPLAQLGNVDTSGITANKDDIALLGFKVATNGALGKYNLVDQTEDSFQDATGIDASTSTNEIRSSTGKYYSGQTSGGNYWGDESDGAATISTDTELTVPSKVGLYDGDMVVKNYSSLTIDATKTLTTDQPGRGLLIYVSGDCTINGTLSMLARGPFANPTSAGGSDSAIVDAGGLKLNFAKSGGTTISGNSNFGGSGTPAVTAVANHAASGVTGVQYTWSRQGAAGGGGGGWGTSPQLGATGTAGTSTSYNLQTGGGAGGGRWGHGCPGNGSYGNCWGGGSGGSSGDGSGPCSRGPDAVAWGGAGGLDICGLTDIQGTNRAAGNPRSDIFSGVDYDVVTGDGLQCNGTGGFLGLIVGGNLTIGASGKIVCDGVQGGSRDNSPSPQDYNAVGGSSGGGVALVVHGGTGTNVTSSYIKADGGIDWNTENGWGRTTGGIGGAGVVQINSIDPDLFNNMTLVSNSTTAQTAPTKGDIVFTYTNGGGTATVGTDITAEVSMDDGSTWTDLGIGAGDVQGTTGGHTIVSKHDVSLTSTSGTSMRYRIKTLNQSATKYTRIQAVSLGWS